MSKTSIAWTDHSVNPVRARLASSTGHYCEKISQGCKHCYSSRMQRRFGMPEFAEQRKNGAEPFLDASRFDEVLKRRKPTKFFWCDMSDLFGAWVPDEWIDQCFAVMQATPQHTHQVLTKRPERMRDYVRSAEDRVRVAGEYLAGQREWCHANEGAEWPLRNVWLGTSVEDQATADERIPLLLQTPAAVRFVSYEPALGAVDFRSVRWWQANYAASAIPSDAPEEPEEIDALSGSMRDGEDMFRVTYEGEYPRLDWIIVGSESGPRRRPMQLEWAHSTVDQCAKAGVACFVKQISNELDHKGEDPQHWPPGHWPREFPTLPAQGAGAVER